MRNTILTTLLFITVLALSACSHEHEPLKSPCPPMSGFFGSPCEATPLNMFDFKERLASWTR